jgi:hypothetical protein
VISRSLFSVDTSLTHSDRKEKFCFSERLVDATKGLRRHEQLSWASLVQVLRVTFNFQSLVGTNPITKIIHNMESSFLKIGH